MTYFKCAYVGLQRWQNRSLYGVETKSIPVKTSSLERALFSFAFHCWAQDHKEKQLGEEKVTSHHSLLTVFHERKLG